jgi:hypothetical protein
MMVIYLAKNRIEIIDDGTETYIYSEISLFHFVSYPVKTYFVIWILLLNLMSVAIQKIHNKNV